MDHLNRYSCMGYGWHSVADACPGSCVQYVRCWRPLRECCRRTVARPAATPLAACAAPRCRHPPPLILAASPGRGAACLAERLRAGAPVAPRIRVPSPCCRADRLRDLHHEYFIGGSNELRDPQYVERGPLRELMATRNSLVAEPPPGGVGPKALTKYGFKTETTGTVKVRCWEGGGERGRGASACHAACGSWRSVCAVSCASIVGSFCVLRACGWCRCGCTA